MTKVELTKEFQAFIDMVNQEEEIKVAKQKLLDMYWEKQVKYLKGGENE